MTRNLKESASITRENILTNVFLWLAMVNVTTEAKPVLSDQVHEYLQQPDSSILISVAPHTGHTDSLMVHEAIRQYFPELLGRHMFVSAQDTWGNSPLKLLFAESLIGPLHQFDREAKNQLLAEFRKLRDRLSDEHKSLIFYPQGGRTIGLKVATSPVKISRMSKRPIVVLSISDEAREVLPKQPDAESARNFIFRQLMRRIRFGLTGQQNVNVKITLEDFIPHDLPETEMLARFRAAHRTDSEGNIMATNVTED